MAVVCSKSVELQTKPFNYPLRYKFRPTILNFDPRLPKRNEEESSAISYFHLMDCTEDDIRWTPI